MHDNPPPANIGQPDDNEQQHFDAEGNAITPEQWRAGFHKMAESLRRRDPEFARDVDEYKRDKQGRFAE